MNEKKKLDPIAAVLQGLFENSKLPIADGFQRYRLEQQWPQVVGDALAAISRPVDFNRGMLVIAVSNPSLLTELQFFREEIITKINSHLGKIWVRKLRFVSE